MTYNFSNDLKIFRGSMSPDPFRNPGSAPDWRGILEVGEVYKITLGFLQNPEYKNCQNLNDCQNPGDFQA